jgi:hypothetical protein
MPAGSPWCDRLHPAGQIHKVDHQHTHDVSLGVKETAQIMARIAELSAKFGACPDHQATWRATESWDTFAAFVSLNPNLLAAIILDNYLLFNNWKLWVGYERLTVNYSETLRHAGAVGTDVIGLRSQRSVDIRRKMVD